MEEGIVEQYVPRPLDANTLFDFLEHFEEKGDPDCPQTPAAATNSGAGFGGRGGGGGMGQRADGRIARKMDRKQMWWRRKSSTQEPSNDDAASVYFSVKGKEDKLRQDDGGQFDRKRDPRGGARTPGRWRPGPPLFAPTSVEDDDTKWERNKKGGAGDRRPG